MRIRLNCHSSTPGAVGYIGDVLDVAESVGQYLCSDGAATALEPFAPFAAAPPSESGGTSHIWLMNPTVEASTPDVPDAPVVTTGNPKRAKA